jgi:hypothetical protein
MKRLLFLVCISLAWLAAPAPALAQNPSMAGPRGYNRTPTVSPYLNLTRGGSTAVNYYNLVRPQIDYGKAINALQQDVTANQQNLSTFEAASALPTTGHATQFQNYKRYFQNQGQGLGGQGLTSRSVTTGSTTRSPSTNRPASTTGTAARPSR